MSAAKKYVEIEDGQYKNERFFGTYELVTNFRKHSYGGGGPRSGKIEVLDENGYKMAVWVDEQDFNYLTGDDVPTEAPAMLEMSEEELDVLIRERFETMERIASGVVTGHIKSLIISGSAGIGKTHTLQEILEAAEKEKKIDGFTSFSGSAGAIGLYKELYNYSGDGDVIVLDDLDALFYDLSAINILKAALDTGEKRKISWLKESRTLKEEEIPNTFEFKGRVVFITNEDFYARIMKRDKLAPHLEAFMSRSSYLDLAIHSIKAIMIRIKQVVLTTNMLERFNVNEEQKHEIINWLEDNQEQLFRVDLRTVIKIASYMAMDPDNWKTTARDCLLKPTTMFR